MGNRAQTRYSYTYLQAHYKDLSGNVVAGPAIPMVTGISSCRTSNTCINTSDELRTTLGYDPNNLLPTTLTVSGGDGALSSTVTKTYDAIGNAITIDGPLSGTADTMRIRYNADREVIGTVGPDPDGNGPRLPLATRLTYDANGWLTTQEVGTVTSQSDAAWANFAPLESTVTTYDTFGRQIQSTRVAAGTTTTVQQFSYDPLGRPDCDAARMNPSIFNSLPASACALGTQGTAGPDRISRTHYDVVGRISSVTVGLGTADQIEDATKTYTPNGLLATLRDANSNQTTYEYDGFDRQAKIRYPSPASPGTSSTSDYEQFSYLATSTVVRGRDGQTTTYYFDGMGRMNYKGVPGTGQDVSYGYDLQGRLTGATFQTSGYPTVSNMYDELGRLSFQTTLGRSVSYQYDAAGNRTQVTYPDGFYVSYGYNAASQLTGVSDSTGVTIASYTYDDLGRRTGITRTSGASTGYAYTAGRLSSLTQDLSGTAYDSSISYTYTPSSQIMTRTQTADATYAWIPLAAGTSNSTFNGLNQATLVDSTSVTHDQLGNLTTGLIASGIDWTYGFDGESRLRSATAGSHTVSLYYDPVGTLSRITSDSDSENTDFLYDGPHLIAEYDDTTGVVKKRYVNGIGADEPLAYYQGASYSDANRRYYHADERGSITALSDASGAGQAVFKYSPYGQSSGLGDSRFGYTGQAWIPTLSLYYYKARFYSPLSGQFIQPDPIRYADDLNLYAYTGSDPINGSDPTGLANCPTTTSGQDAACVETPQSAALPDEPPPSSDATQKLEQVVVTAERAGKDSNGQRIIFTDGNEHGYVVNDTVIVQAPLKSLGSINCGNGLSVEKFKLDVVPGTTIGHTHPNSYQFPGSVPGPGDNQAAQSSSAKTAFTLTSKNVFTIESMPNGTYRVTVHSSSGNLNDTFSDEQRKELIKNMQNWENPAASGPGLTDKQRYCGKK